MLPWRIRRRVDRHRTGHRGPPRRPLERAFERGTIVLGHQVGQRPTLDDFGIVAEQPGHGAGYRLDAAVGRDQHGDGRGVVDQRAQPGVVVVHQLEAPPLGEVADGRAGRPPPRTTGPGTRPAPSAATRWSSCSRISMGAPTSLLLHAGQRRSTSSRSSGWTRSRPETPMDSSIERWNMQTAVVLPHRIRPVAPTMTTASGRRSTSLAKRCYSIGRSRPPSPSRRADAHRWAYVLHRPVGRPA